ADQGEWAAAGQPADAEAVPNAVAGLLTAMAAEAPLVIVVDDLHDATAETIKALALTLNQLAGPVLVLLLGRPELVRTAGALTRLSEAEVHALPPLRGADAARLLTSYLAGGKLPQADADRLLATAQGNPFYLAELVTLLMERGALTVGPERGGPAGGNWRLAPGSLGSRLLSRDLAAVLAARIDALPPEARSVLRDAAVVGDTVPGGALAALREQRAGRDGRPAAVVAVELERAVEELLQRRMLHRTRSGYSFATPLMREAAYSGVSKAELAERHAALARWAAPGAPGEPAAPGGFTDAARDAFVAEHVERAAALADAVKLRPDAPARTVGPLGVAALGRAARRSLQAGEPAVAVEYAERAAELARGSVPAALRVLHARALLQVGRAADALAYAEKIAANAGDEAGTQASALLLAGQAHQTLGDQARATACWQEALQVATAGELPNLRASAMRRLGMADFVAGRLSQASSRLAASYQVSLTSEDRRGQAWSLQNLAWVTTTRGDFAGTDAVLGRAARLFAELKDPYGRAWLRGTTAFARLLAGRLREACRLARVFLPFGERVGEAWAVGTLRAVEAFATAELGELAEADRAARRAYRDFAEVSDDWGQGFALVVRGVVARGLGEPAHAADLLTDALSYAARTSHPLLAGMAGTLCGFVALDMGDHETAEQAARTVLTAVEPHNPQAPVQVGPRVLLATARLAAGDPATAVGLLAPVATGAANSPSMLVSRRQTMARYADALLAHGQREQALDWARRAVAAPAEDVRSQVIAASVLAEALAACGRPAEALASADEAVRLAYATEQRSERAAADALRARLAAMADPAEGAAAS
ncbi:adenylate/guanylate cyclase domain-containing protein, partial [Micromonospora olivasterospora]